MGADGLAMRALHFVSSWGGGDGGGGSCKAYKVLGVVANTILVRTRNNAFTGCQAILSFSR